MRVFGQSLAVFCLAAGVLVAAQGTATPPATSQAAAPKKTAEEVLAAARTALGGAKLDAVKSFIAKGRTRRLQGNNLLPIEFEISCELPDRYVRKDETPATESDPTSRGFNADKLIQIPAPVAPPTPPPGAAAAAGAGRTAGAPPASGDAGRGAAPPATAGAGRGGDAMAITADPGGRGAPPAMSNDAGGRGAPPAGSGRAAGPPPSPATSVKQDFARLTLGMFAQSFSSYPLTFTYIGQAEAPQGKADVIEVKGAPNFTVRLFVNTATHLPVMIGWTTPVTPALVVITVPGQPKPVNPPPGARIQEGPPAPAATASQEEKDKYTKAITDLRKEMMAKPIDNWLFYADYRTIEGLTFPHRLRRAVGNDTTEETTFNGFEINAKINPKKFEPVK